MVRVKRKVFTGMHSRIKIIHLFSVNNIKSNIKLFDEQVLNLLNIVSISGMVDTVLKYVL